MWENVLINNKEMLYELFFFYMIVFNGYFVFFVVRFLILYRKKINLDSRYWVIYKWLIIELVILIWLKFNKIILIFVCVYIFIFIFNLL